MDYQEPQNIPKSEHDLLQQSPRRNSIPEPSQYADPLPPQDPHTVGQVFTPGVSSPVQASSNSSDLGKVNLPSQNLTPSMSSEPVYSQPMISASSIQQEGIKKKKFKPSKKFAILAGIPLLIAGGGAAAYFGYIIPNKPENIWRTALTNTGKGYDKVTEYATSKKDVKDTSIKGSFKISGSLAADGAFNGNFDGKNGKLNGSVSAAGLKVDYDVRAIESPGNSSDIYFKIDGIQGLGDLVGGYAGMLGSDSTGATKALNGLNGQWYFIDHTLFDQFAQGSNDNLQISSTDVSAALKAVGDSSMQYLFTNDPEKMAIVVKQNVGKEKQDGRNVYHYKVGVNKENLKAYNKSLCDNLIKTRLFKLFSQGGRGDEDFSKECNDSTGIDKIKNSQTADAWVDLRTKLIHKLRFHEEKNSNNYVDIIQDYQGGDEFPFSLGFYSQSSIDGGVDLQNKTKPDVQTGLIKMKLNMKTNAFTADANFENSGSTKDKATFNLSIAPSNDKANVEKPAGAKTIIELINDLGFGEL